MLPARPDDGSNSSFLTYTFANLILLELLWKISSCLYDRRLFLIYVFCMRMEGTKFEIRWKIVIFSGAEEEEEEEEGGA